MIRLAIVEDETLVRQGLTSLFCAVHDFDVVAAVESEAGLLKFSGSQEVEVVLVDVFDARTFSKETGSRDAISGLVEVMTQLPNARFVLMDDKPSGFRLTQAMSHGFSGCVSKYDSFEEVVTVIRAAAQCEARTIGNLTMSVSFMDLRRSTVVGLSVLSPRELEVMKHLVQGLTVNRCAERLAISSSTVDNHKSRMMKKLKVHKISDLVRLAVREGLISVKQA